jgi:DNA (cytosine-5)-methyltransferase 1
MKRILVTFGGVGGGAHGYALAGLEPTCVDIEPSPRNPYPCFQADALEVLADSTFSPPCQSYLNLTRVNEQMGRAPKHPDLMAVTRALLQASGKPYVIENVADARKKMVDPVRLCGTAFDLPLRRHRLFESNVPLVGTACAHHRFTKPRYWTGWRPKGEHRLSTVVQVYGNAGGREHWNAAMGIDWMTPAELVLTVPPAYTAHVGRQLLAA